MYNMTYNIYTLMVCPQAIKFSLPDFSLRTWEKLGERYGIGELTQRRLKLELYVHLVSPEMWYIHHHQHDHNHTRGSLNSCLNVWR